ncbi:MAG: M28 family peptidase [Thermoleophilia bacterium]|nr:M28 family peptidase [Thermoleophilia bacterium]MDH4344927.1 M28 family peptidase [Thermoleophilia bacterium]MDH5333341.1 M28 family peptidase [Thermoleophilia bacterium]
MVPARPRITVRRPRRGPVDRPLNLRLARTASLVLIAPILLLVLTLVPPGALPRPELPPAFDGSVALRLARELARDYPDREPGSPGAARAAGWYRDTLRLYGLPARADRWVEDVPGLGRQPLLNLVTVVPGTSEKTIVIVAHRDNRELEAGANDNASGTAALLELARAYATTGTIARRPTPVHTLVFVSTDAGAFGALGAARFARSSPLAQRAVATITLDGLAGRARPRLEVSSTAPRSPTPVLVRTIAARIADQTGSRPAAPGWLTQLVNLGLPFGYGEQAPFLAAGSSAVRLSTAPDVETKSDPVADTLDPRTLERLGRATDAAVSSLDEAVRLTGGTTPYLYAGDGAVRGWAIAALFVAALLPFWAVTIDLLARVVRSGLALAPPWRAFRLRFGVWLLLAALVVLGSLAGVFPRGAATTPVPDAPPVEDWPGTALVGAALAVSTVVWIASRIRQGRSAPLSEEEQLTGYAVAFLALGGAAVLVAAVNSYALVFVLPSLYAWLWLPVADRLPAWVSDVLLGLGLAGPVLGLVVLAEQLDLGLRAPVYAIGLATSGTVPWPACLAFLVWAAAGTQLAALVAGRYPAPSSR